MPQRALIIGVDDYPFQALSSCVKDAVAMRKALVDLGIFKGDECTLMTSPQVDGSTAVPTRKAILDFLKPLYNGPPIARLLVFFAGHGLSARLARGADELRTVIVPAGVTQLRDSGDELVDLDELLGRFARRGAHEQFWIIDACRNLSPDGHVPSVANIGWDRPQINDPREAHSMAQGVLYAVAPLGKAGAVVGGHGFLTTHVLDGLWCRGPAQWGSAAAYDEGLDSWLIDLESLCDHAKRRLAAGPVMATWQREYLTPRVAFGELRPGPLRNLGALLPRPFSLTVEPSAATDALEIALTVKRNPVAAWPPRKLGEAVPLPPERYRLVTTLKDPRWRLPERLQPIVDVRESDSLCIQLNPRGDAGKVLSVETLAVSLDGDARPAADGTAQEAFRKAAPLPEVAPASVSFGGHAKDKNRSVVVVRASDPGAHVRMTRLSGGSEERQGAPNQPIEVRAGLWRIDVQVGADTISTCEEDLADGFAYEIMANAQVTPALAALMDPGDAIRLATFPVRNLMPSETIGPMQGAILPTLLPLLALKPLDRNGVVLQSFAPRLRIPLWAGTYSSSPAALAIAFEGGWSDERSAELLTATRVRGGAIAPLWMNQRVALYLDPAPHGDSITIDVPTVGRFDVAAPQVRDRCSTVCLTLWPDGRYDVSTSLFALPPGVDNLVHPGRLARALALAARFYQAGTSLDAVNFDVFQMVSYGSWGDLVLGALAWLGRARWVAAQTDLTPAVMTDIANRQAGVLNFLLGQAPDLPDTRIIAALAQPEPARDRALADLLDDGALSQPVLAEAVAALARTALGRQRLDHWSVVRFQRLPRNAVFNAALGPSIEEN